MVTTTIKYSWSDWETQCDEQRPCGACHKHGVSCSLMDSSATTSKSTTTALPARPSSRRILLAPDGGSVSNASHSAPSEASLKGDSGQRPQRLENVALDVSFLRHSSPGSSEFEDSSLLDLELMHHYTTTVYCTFPHGSVRPKYFQQEVPRLALRHQFLLHQLLAVSAFHFLHVSKSSLPSTYFHRAVHHHTKSLSGIRDALEAEVTLDRATALFMASSFVLSSTYASRRHVEDDATEGDAIDDVMGMVTLFRGVGVVQSTTTKTLSKDVLKEIFGDDMQVSPKIEPWMTEYSKHLETLKACIKDSPNLVSKMKNTVVAGCQVLLDAAWSSKASDKGIISTVGVRMFYRWPYWIGNDFLQLVRDREPVALAVLLFYCVVMQQTEITSWFLHGWSARLASVLSEHVKGTQWVEYVQWALDFMRQVQNREATVT